MVFLFNNFKTSTVIISCFVLFSVLAAAFFLSPVEVNLVKTSPARVISKINMLAAIVPCGLSEDDPSQPGQQDVPCTICHLYILVGNLINFVIWNIAIPLAALMFLLAAVYLIFSGGSEERIKTGRAIFQNTVIALLIVFVSWLVLTELFGYLTSGEIFNFKDLWSRPFICK